MQENQIFRYAEAWKLHTACSGGSALSTRKRQPGQVTAAAMGTHQTGSSCLGWLMSMDIYCHWVGCCILRGTAAFPIGQLCLNGQQTHNEAQGWRNGCSGSDSQICFLPGNCLINTIYHVPSELFPFCAKKIGYMFFTKGEYMFSIGALIL